jgi:hypothetical protein|tara:strand:+ start:11748 stop:12134 length:387 start_codon:yes stop_codon:yes gene_type:complete
MEFEATEEQIDVRGQARRLYDQGVKLVGQWCHRIPNLTIRKWNDWISQDGFLDWWRDLFPEHACITHVDILALEYESTQALMHKISDGDMQAVQIAMKMVEMAKERAEVTTDQGIDKWFTSEDDEWFE